MTAYTIALADVWGYLIVGSRLLGLITFFPGFSNTNVPHRTRIFLVAGLAGILTPLIFTTPPLLPQTAWMTTGIILKEVAIGLFASLTLKAFFSALDIAGSIMGLQTSLSNVFVNNTENSQQSGLITAFLNITAVTLMFLTDLHYVILSIFLKTYQTGGLASLGSFSTLDFSTFFLEVFSGAVILGITMAGPLIIISVLIYGIAGILNRLIPQMQVFFLVQPLQLFLGFGILLLILPLTMDLFMDKLADLLALFGESL